MSSMYVSMQMSISRAVRKSTGEEGEEEEGRRGQQHDDDSNHVRHSIGADERYGNEMLMGESSETSNTNSPTTKSPC